MYLLNAKILSAGLAGLLAATPVLSVHATKCSLDYPLHNAAYSSQQPSSQQTYRLTFVEREALFEIGSDGKINPVGESDWTKASMPEDVTHSGNADQIIQRYAQFRQRIPDLGLGRHLTELADNLNKNQFYLVNDNNFRLEANYVGTSSLVNLAVTKNIEAGGSEYAIFLNAFGKFSGDKLVIDDLGIAKVSSHYGLESRVDARDTEMHYWYEDRGNGTIMKHRAEIRGESINDLELSGWLKMRQGILNQQLSKSDLRPAPGFSQRPRNQTPASPYTPAQLQGTRLASWLYKK